MSGYAIHPSSSSLADALLAGPRGRRLLLEFALASEELRYPDFGERDLVQGVFAAARDLDPDEGASYIVFERVDPGAAAPNTNGARPETVTPTDVAVRLAAVPLAEVTPELLRQCLAASVDAARYWQEPDGDDILAGRPELRDPLRRIADHLAASPHTAWWSAPVDERAQWQVEWDGDPERTVPADPHALLRQAADTYAEQEAVALRERPTDPAANWGGAWWSTPVWELPHTTQAFTDQSPVGLWCVEDSHGRERATARLLRVPAGLRVYEVDSADAWAELCRRFPTQVTAQKRHDWYRTTGRDGVWVMPNWALVARHYDGVHMQARAYLSAAGTAIPVDAHTASVIAGWDPDETYWFTPLVRYSEETVEWALGDSGDHHSWVRGSTDS